MPAAILKVSVLADGAVLLDGKRVTLEELARAMDATPGGNTAVWYYREDAASDGPTSALEVMELIVERRLPVRLSSKPDFSDVVTLQGPVIEQLFASIRQRAAERQLVIQRSDGRQMRLPALAKEAAPPQAVAAVERLLPSTTQRNVAVIANTSWAITEKPSAQDAASAIPFFGLLMGFAAIGHAVWVFDGTAAPQLAAGCRDADVVIVDGDCLKGLPEDWQTRVEPVMRTPRILLYDRTTRQLRRP